MRSYNLGMRIAVVGLWHLGCVYSACLASLGHEVVGIDEDVTVVELLQSGGLPVREPGLVDLISRGVNMKSLSFSDNFAVIEDADIVWLAIDTPVLDDDTADVTSVMAIVDRIVPYLRLDTVVVVSSQLPVGSCRKIRNLARKGRPNSRVEVVCSPENLRLGSALTSFLKADRIVIGSDSESAIATVIGALESLAIPTLVMSLESAELVKHALNAFLAMSVAFANEIGQVAEAYNADAWDVSRALKTDRRIGPRSYVQPGGPIAGGTLARDIRFLEEMGKEKNLQIPVLSSILESHDWQRTWPLRVLTGVIEPASGVVLVLGLAYKAGSSTLRRSFGLHVAHELVDAGFKVWVLDGGAESLPDDADRFTRVNTLNGVIDVVSAIVICAMEESILQLPILLSNSTKQPLIVDVIGALHSNIDLPDTAVVLTPGKGVNL